MCFERLARGTALNTFNRVLSLRQVSLAEACDSGKFTASGQCCSLCPAGFRVEAECGEEDTKCAPCPQGEQLLSKVSPPTQEDISPALKAQCVKLGLIYDFYLGKA